MAKKAKTTDANTSAVEDSVADMNGVDEAGGEDELEAGHVVDLITGEGVKLSDLEQIRQEEERKLLEEFGYPATEKKDLIRLDLRVQPRQLKARRFSLVVLRPKVANELDEDRIAILIDIQKPKTKAEDSKKGAELTAEYLRDTPKSEFAVWTNGTDRIVYWKEPGKIKVRSVLVNDIPRFGKGAEDCFTQSRSVLRVAGGLSLRQAFQRCHNYIYANRGGSNETIFWEFLKVVFAKIQDERNLQKGLATGIEVDRKFLIASLEERNDDAKAEQVKARLDSLYHQVRAQYPELFGAAIDTIDLPAPIVAYVVAQLAEYDFLNSSVDVKGEAYEAIVGKNLQGTRGEFFTPRNAVKMGIRMLDPEPGMKCIDPSCGTGGFIVVILNYVAEKIRAQMLEKGLKPDGKDVEKYNHHLRLAAQSVFGLDINPNLVRVARMNMLMNNDGQGGITHLDSLGPPEKWTFAKGTVKHWQANGKWTDVQIPDFFGDELQFGTFDIVATNPPFGAKIKIDSEAVLSQYELARKWNYDENRKIWTSLDFHGPELANAARCADRLPAPEMSGCGSACVS